MEILSKIGFSEVLFKKVEEVWDKYLQHPFVKAIGEGTLDKEKFKNYLIQDYLYLKDYGKVFALGIVKSKSMKEMKFYHNAISGIVNDESAVHIEYLNDFGFSPEETEKQKCNLTTASYTNFMLGIALKGNCKEIAMATMPCTWSYYYIGKYLYDTYRDNLNNNFYSPWIKEYSSESFRLCVEEWRRYIDDICKDLSSDEEEELIDIFIKASLYELEFWNMANK